MGSKNSGRKEDSSLSLEVGRKLEGHSIWGNSTSRGVEGGESECFVNITEGKALREIR